MSNVTYLPWVPQDGEPTEERVAERVPASTRTVAFTTVEAEDVAPEEVVEAVSVEEVYEALLRKLGMADMSAHEVRGWLRERELDASDIEELVAKVKHLGYVDDFRLAEQLTHRLSNRKGQGRTAIGLELRKRNLAQAAIDEALASIDSEAEFDRAFAQAAQRAQGLQRFDKATAERRLHGFLARRGYPADVIREAIKAAFSEYPPIG